MANNPLNPNHPRNLLLLLSILQFFLISSALFSPPDDHLLACGSSSVSTLHDHRVFLPDSTSNSAFLLSSTTRKISVSAEPNPSLDSSPLYRTARVFTRPSSYEFHIKKKGTHLIRLHFYPFPTQKYNLSSALFHVSASGFVLLSKFRTSTPSIKEYFLPVDTEKLVISFTPACRYSFAFVNAIEVFSAPGDLVPDVARLVLPDRIEKLDGLSKQALETLQRINVGGPKVTPFNDTLWRTWMPDDGGFLDSSSASKIVSFSGRIMYRKDGASREVAPNSVYSSARVMNSVNSSEPKTNMTWVFPVNSGYRYLIRLHFCDIASLALNQLYVNVYINGYSAYEDLDISDATGQVLASPYYVDFVADPDSSGLLSVCIGPSRLSSPLWIDSLLNGLEVMKINNSVGSLDGQLPVNSVLETRGRGGVGAFVRAVVCGFAFMSLSVIGLMLVMRWRAASRNPMAWSPLPVDVSEGKLAYGNPAASGKLIYY